MNTNYRLIDSGNGRRLERFGSRIVIRPACQAEWKPAFGSDVWNKASLIFSNGSWNTDVSGMGFEVFFNEVKFHLRPMAAGQLGIFPEQEGNWAWLEAVTGSSKQGLNIINGFAFTGGSTLFSSAPGTAVCHVDGSGRAIKDARRNALVSMKNLNNIRWIRDDVLSFMRREIRRGRKYDGFIFDPPAFGRGRGKEWKLMRDLPLLFDSIGRLSRGCPEFVLVTAHDPALTVNAIVDLFGTIDGINVCEVEGGQLEVKAESGRNLSAGIFVRWKNRSRLLRLRQQCDFKISQNR